MQLEVFVEHQGGQLKVLFLLTIKGVKFVILLRIKGYSFKWFC